MEKTVITVKELSQRWGIYENTIRRYLAEGRLQSSNIPGGGVFFSLSYIEKLEQCEEQEPMSPLERKRLLNKIEQLEAQVDKFKASLTKIQIEAMQTTI